MTKLKMTDYFEDHLKKPALTTNDLSIIEDNPRTDLLLEQYKLTRERLANQDRLDYVDEMYEKWCDLLILGFNIVVHGPQSKFAVLETFKRRYLDSGRLPDWLHDLNKDKKEPCAEHKTKAAGSKVGCKRKEYRPPTRKQRPRKVKHSEAQEEEPEEEEPDEEGQKQQPKEEVVEDEAKDQEAVNKTFLKSTNQMILPTLNITTVRLHGLDPIKAETFNHAIFGIKETRRVRDGDFHDFKHKVTSEKMHYVFLLHSFDRFLEACEDICDTIFQLYRMIPRYVHLIMSTDSWNAGKKTMNLKYTLRLIFFSSPLFESYFWEKTILFDNQPEAAQANETTIHRLFSDKVDLQSLKDIHLAIDSATQYILVYIMRDYLDKWQSNQVAEMTDERKRFQARDAEDDEEHELGPQDTTRKDTDSDPPRRLRDRAVRATRAAVSVAATPRKRLPTKPVETSLEFNHLLRHCESKFILRRSTALRDHLGELKDHMIVSEDDSGNIQCLVEPKTCKRFIEWIELQGLE